jgi:hypothetical protein
MAAPHDRHDDDDDDEKTGTGWSAPRPSPGAMGAAHDDLFGVPTAAPREPDSDAADDDESGGPAETDVEGDGDDDGAAAAGEDGIDDRGTGRRDRDGRSVGAEETDVEGRSGATEPDGDGSRTSVV